MSSHLTKTWALNQTTTDVISIGTGVLAAATSDNVQPLAILACEGFGATLPMTAETRAKVSKLCTQEHQSAVLSFLKVTIGYKRGDCGWQLAQSDAGTRFLGLAAALLTLETWNAATVLNDLILETAENKTLVPTTLQLKQLLQALEYRLALSSFAENALGWSLLLGTDNAPGKRLPRQRPSQALIVKLVQAISRVCRIGEETAQRVEIRVSSAEAPWIIALVKWCIGNPTVVTDGAATICDESDSPAIVRVSLAGNVDHKPQIAILDEVGEVSHLIRELPNGTSNFAGMVGIKPFFEVCMRETFGAASSLAFQACIQAFPRACFIALRSCYTPCQVKCLPDSCTATPASHLPPPDNVWKTIGLLLNDETGDTSDMSDGTLVHDLPLVEAVRKICMCTHCGDLSTGTVKIWGNCAYATFLRNVSSCVSSILQISLIRSPDPGALKLDLGIHGLTLGSTWSEMEDRIAEALSGNTLDSRVKYDFNKIMDQSFALLHHDSYKTSSMSGSWRTIVSSGRGQTLYPRLYQTNTVGSESMLEQICIPGALWWRGERFPCVLSELIDPTTSQEETDIFSIDTPKDAYPGFRILWQVSPVEVGLSAKLVCPDFPELPQKDPRAAIDCASKALFVDCSHGGQSSVSQEYQGLCLTSPAQPRPLDLMKIGIVLTDRNEKMRLFALGALRSGSKCVIRRNACLECCIVCCKEAGRQVIIC